MNSYLSCVRASAFLLVWLGVMPLSARKATAQIAPLQTAAVLPPAKLPNIFDTPIKIDVDSDSMDGILAIVLKGTAINTLVDGHPLLKKAKFKFAGRLQDALDSVADAFDYSWTRSKRGTLLFTKLFTNPDERPQVNLPEMLEMSRNMVSALTLIDYDKDESQWPLMIRQAAQTFTKEQLRVLGEGGRLSGDDLTGPQKQLLQQAILSNTFLLPMNLWQDLLPKLANMPNSRLQAQKQDSADENSSSPKHDYKFIYRSANGQLHVYDLPHILFGHNGEQIATP